jgi:hypothetical protein
MGKSIPKVWAVAERFNALLNVNNHPLGENSPNLVTVAQKRKRKPDLETPQISLKLVKKSSKSVTRLLTRFSSTCRCCDHNFRQISTNFRQFRPIFGNFDQFSAISTNFRRFRRIFDRKNGYFFENQCYDQCLA